LALGYTQRKDYVREKLGISLREAEELSSIERRILEYPETSHLWNDAQISRCHVRLILRSVSPDAEFVWARLATLMTVRELEETLERLSPSHPEPQAQVLEFTLSEEQRLEFDLAIEICRRMCGSDLDVAAFLESCAAEFVSGAPLELIQQACDEDRPDPSALRREAEQYRHQAEKAAELKARAWRHLNRGKMEQACLPEFTVTEDADAWALDQKLRHAVHFQQALDDVLLHKLWEAERLRIETNYGCATFQQYLVELLGLSPRTAYRLRSLRRALAGQPEVAEAFATARLTRCQAAEVARVATPHTAESWIEFAERTPVARLQQVIKQALAEGCELLPPTAEFRTCSKGQAVLEQATTDLTPLPMCAESPAGIPRLPEDRSPVPCLAEARMRILIDDDQRDIVELGLRMANIALGGHANRSDCIQFLVRNFIASYLATARKAAQEHPIAERDGWRCAVPGCTARGVQVHHIEFQSQGGTDDPENEVCLCVAHHLKGIHEGRIKARGLAPHGIVWVLGIHPDGLADQVFADDTLVATKEMARQARSGATREVG
ncbi:MAG TPA: HNH endonuclease signature motif containing protein, partial [Candidatus Xenobia bacterium]